MNRLMACAAFLAAGLQSGKEEEKPKLPPFTVVITAKIAGTPEVERQAFERGLKELRGYAKQIARMPIRDDKGMYEQFTFEIAGELKFDPTPLWRAFVNVKCRKYELTLTGTLSQEAQTKKLFITSYSGKTKVKLMNRPKGAFDDPDAKVEDVVGKLAERMTAKGKLHYTVTGELFNSGGALALLLETYDEAPPPPPPPKPKEPKK